MLRLACDTNESTDLDDEVAAFVDALPASLPPLRATVRTPARTAASADLLEFVVARLQATPDADPALLGQAFMLLQRLRCRSRLAAVDDVQAALSFATAELLRQGFERAMAFRNDGSVLSVVSTEFITADDWAVANHDIADANPVPLVDHLFEAAVIQAQAPALIEQPLDDSRVWKPIVAPMQCNDYVVAPLVVDGRTVGTIHADCYFSATPLDLSHRDLIGRLATDISIRLDACRSHTAPVQLSPRELQVYDGLVRGLTNQAIADELVLGVETIKTYVSRLLNKLDVPNRSAAAGLALTRPTPTTSPTTSAERPSPPTR